MIRMTLALTTILALTMAFWPTQNGIAREVSLVEGPVAALAHPQPIAMQQHEIATVGGRNVNFRAGPSRYFEIFYTLPRGARVEILATPQPDWVQLRDLATGQIGFMSADFVSRS